MFGDQRKLVQLCSKMPNWLWNNQWWCKHKRHFFFWQGKAQKTLVVGIKLSTMLNAKLLVNKIGTPLFAVLNPIFIWESQSTGHPIVMHQVQIVFWGAPILVTNLP